MPVIHQFGGILPRSPEHMLSPEMERYARYNKMKRCMASDAHDVKLTRGAIEAWREPLMIQDVRDDSVTVRVHDCCVRTWDRCVSITPYLPDYGRMFVTGRGDRAETVSAGKCDGEYYPLGVPAPTRPPRLSAARETGEDCDVRAYAYTYVNGYGEESAPSPPSEPVTVRDGSSVTVSGIDTPPDGWNILGVRVYRTATGSRDMAEPEHQAATGYFCVASLGGFPSSYTDTIMTRRLGSPLSTEDGRVPPAGLRHISHLAGTGVLCGVTDNRLHFSENFQPHNWPAEFDMTFPSRIVHMTTLDTTVFLTTLGKAYAIDAANFCEARKLKDVRDTDIPLPDIGCGYASQRTVTPFGLIFAGRDGLVLFKPDSSYSFLTSPWYSPAQWARMRPETARLAYWQGNLFCVTDTAGFVLGLDPENRDSEFGALTTISDRPTDMTVTESGELLMLMGGRVWQWDAGDRPRPYRWKSIEIDNPATVCWNSMRLKSDGTRFTLMTEDPGVSFECDAGAETTTRIPRLGRRRKYWIRFEGTGAVEYIELGTALSTLEQGV
jgi:hypothetical protein